MATQDAADISLEKAVEESLTLYELQERDPAAFPALPNRQEEDGPKSFWSGAKETETTTKSSQEDYTLMNKVHSSERIESENAAHNYQRAVLRSTVTPGGGFTGSENGPITTSPPAAPVLPHSQIAMPQGFGTQQQYSPSPSVLPYMPLLMVPHTDSMGPINYNAVPSVDRTGSDLPHNDPSTMRFFFNLGCEYFRVTSMVQMQNQQSVQQPPVTPTQAQNIPQVTLGPPMGTTYFTNMYHTGGPVSASLQPNLDVTTPPVTIETPVTMMMQPEEHMTSQATSQMLLPGYNQSAMITNSQSGYQVAPQGTNAVSGGDGIVYAAQQPSAQHQQFPPQGAVYYSNPTASYPLPTQPGVGSPPQQYNPYMSYPVPNMVPGQVQMIATSVPAGSVSGAAAHPGSVVYSHVPSANVNVSPPQQQQQQPPPQQQQQTSQQHQQQQQAAAAQFASLPPPPPPGAAGPAPLVQPSAPYTPQSAPNVQQVFSYTA